MQSTTNIPEGVETGDGSALTSAEAEGVASSRGTPEVEQPAIANDDSAAADQMRRVSKELILS
ncbi:unannotated protein [freshwater metagenome]|uniref:Unannotated protein n=1 Tax=freshwater metagenome TaxID=449393 RepID=A0A6J7V5B7_9ZZZZ